MTRDPNRPTITPEMVEQFARYRWNEPVWGSLHIVLDDDNLDTSHVEFCITWAKANGDVEGAWLANILLTLTRSQRGRIGKKAEEWLNLRWRWMLALSRSTGAYWLTHQLHDVPAPP